MDWMLGWTPPEPPHLKETLEETLARELNQDGQGVQPTHESQSWSGGSRSRGTMVSRHAENTSATSPMIALLETTQCSVQCSFTDQTSGHTTSPCLGRRERTGRCSTRRAPRTTPYSPMLPSLSISTTPPPSGGQAQCPSPLNILRA